MLQRLRTSLDSVLERAQPLLRGARAVIAHPVVRWTHRGLVALILLWCTRKLAEKVAPHYPIDQWLFWVYARIWIWALFFAVACLSAGHLVVGWIMARGLSLRARAVYSFACGVLVFFMAMFVAGLFRAYGGTFAVGLPAVLALVGAWPLGKRIHRAKRHIAAARRRGGKGTWWTWPVAGFGVLAVCAIYFTILTPSNIAFDSHFYHLGLAQQYAAERGITRSPEGWLLAAIPHLASVLYTWALLVPGFPPVERVLLASHLEFVLFVATLASLPVLVRWLVPRSRAGLSWVAVFLFPGIYLYDSSLTTAADHVAAFWAPAVYLAFGQAWRSLEPRRCAILAALLGGALLTKYQSVQLALLPVLGVAVRSLYLGARAGAAAAIWRRRPQSYAFLLGPLLAAAVGLAVTAPHWLKNIVWYGDPLYPYLQGSFTPRPFVPDAPDAWRYFTEYQVGQWKPQGTDREKMKETLWALYKFSFEPHNWPRFHGLVPVFGSLYTLCAFVLPFLGKTKRLWGIYLGAALAILQWYWSMHQDRYLQVVLPWMAAAVAGTIALVWRLGIVPRLAMACLVGLQLVWGGDVYFIPGHAMAGSAPVKTVSDLIAMGYKKKYDRLQIGGEFEKMSKDLPRNAKVLNHEENRRLGLWRPVVSDLVPWQYGIRWGRLPSPRAMHELLRDLGVTHVVWRTSKSRTYDTLAGDLRFFEFVTSHVGPAKRYGGRSLAPLTPEPPGEFGDVVAYLGCGRFYGRGKHRLDALNVYELWPRPDQKMVPAEVAAPADAGAIAAFVSDADFVVVGTSCKPAVGKDVLGEFVLAATRGKEQLWVRKRAGSAAPPEPPASSPTDDDDDPLLR